MISFTRKQNIKYLLTILVIAVIVLGGAKLYNSRSQNTEKNRNRYTEESPKNIFDTLKSHKGNLNYTLIDFRTPGEFKEEHISGSVWISYFDPEYKEKLSTLDKNKTYFVYDKAGRVTAKIVKKMQDLGFREVHRMTGGINEWKQQMLPINFQN